MCVSKTRNYVWGLAARQHQSKARSVLINLHQTQDSWKHLIAVICEVTCLDFEAASTDLCSRSRNSNINPEGDLPLLNALELAQPPPPRPRPGKGYPRPKAHVHLLTVPQLPLLTPGGGARPACFKSSIDVLGNERFESRAHGGLLHAGFRAARGHQSVGTAVGGGGLQTSCSPRRAGQVSSESQSPRREPLEKEVDPGGLSLRPVSLLTCGLGCVPCPPSFPFFPHNI